MEQAGLKENRILTPAKEGEEETDSGVYPTDSWETYTKWLQGTLNRNLVFLELGVGMELPQLIRFPSSDTNGNEPGTDRIFDGIVPLWGYQMLITLFLAHLFRLNKVIALVAANISIPPIKIPSMMASTIFRLDSRVFSTWSVKNRLQLLHDSLRSRLRGTIQRQVISTSTVFSTLIRVKSRNGRKWDTRSACGG